MAQAKATRFELQVEQRKAFGRRAAKALRKDGFVPVNFYSGGDEAMSYVMTQAHLREAMHSGDKIFNITIDGEQRRAMVKDIQWHPVTDQVIHVDFLGVRLRDIIEIPVPVIAVGTAAGMAEGGLLQQQIHEVIVRCKGEDVPDDIEVDITDLNIGDAIHASDLSTESYEIMMADDISILSIVIPQKMEVEAAVVDEDELEFEDSDEETEAGDEETTTEE